ncbi:metal ABC transporter permease [Candidatus Woesebacteria bacterium]|nr:metal ABC transporter permease [Candidatus Woesebacteria bacterium]
MILSEKLILALAMTTAIGAVAGYLGTLMLSKRMSLVGGPLGHLTLPGITLALIYGFDVSIGAFLVLILAIILIWVFEKRTKLPLETLTAIVFSSSVAVAFLFLPHEEIEIALIGDISQLSLATTLVSLLISAAVFLLVNKIYKRIVFIAVSEDLAKSEEIDVDKYNLIYLFAVALVIGLGIRIVGSLLTAAIVSIPAATSKNLSVNMRQYAYGGAVAGGLAAIAGIVVYSLFPIPAGPAIIISSAVLFLLSMIFRRKT